MAAYLPVGRATLRAGELAAMQPALVGSVLPTTEDTHQLLTLNCFNSGHTWTSADIQNTKIATRGHGARGHAVLAADTRGQLRTLRGHARCQENTSIFGLDELSILSLSASAVTQPPRTSRSRGPCALTAEAHITPRHAQRKLSTPPKCQWRRDTCLHKHTSTEKCSSEADAANPPLGLSGWTA